MPRAPAPLRTERLILHPCDARLAAAACAGDWALLGALLDAHVPPEWPLPDLGRYLPTWAERVKADPGLAGWGVWLVVHALERQLIGDAGFKGRPQRNRSVELGCGILPAWRCLGLGTEATGALVDWAAERAPIYSVFAEAGPGDAAARRMLTRLGFAEIDPGPRRALWRRDLP